MWSISAAVRISVYILIIMPLFWRGRGVPIPVRPPSFFQPSRAPSMHPRAPGLSLWRLFRGQQQQLPVIVKVVTDIDDTVVSSGGIKLFGIPLGGIDTLYRRGQFYPGVIQFTLELSKSMARPASASASAPSNVAVLTARAKEFKFALALKANGKLCSAYKTIGQMNGVEDWGIKDVYYGSVAEWVWGARKGWRKFSNFELLMQNDDKIAPALATQRKYILIGDTGEKDEEAGERMAGKHPERVRGIFLHHVFNHRTLPSSAMPADRQVNGVPVFYFRTYVGAAVKAYGAQLLGKEAVRRVCVQAVQQLQQLDQAIDPAANPRIQLLSRLPGGARLLVRMQETQASRWQELDRDARQCAFLHGLVPAAAPVPSAAAPAAAAPVLTVVKQ